MSPTLRSLWPSRWMTTQVLTAASMLPLPACPVHSQRLAGGLDHRPQDPPSRPRPPSMPPCSLPEL